MEYIQPLVGPVGVPLAFVIIMSNYAKIKNVLFPPKSIITRPTTVYDQFCWYALNSAGIFYWLMVFYPYENLYAELKIDADTPSFAMKRQCTEERFELCDLLVGNDNRNIYQVHGNSLQTCSWCRTNYDHFLYNLPAVLWWYVSFLAIVGGLTGNWRRMGWRLYVLITAGIGFAMEVGAGLTEEPVRELPWYQTQHTFLLMIRCGFFGAWLLFLGLIVGKKDTWTDEEIVKNLIQSTSDTRLKYLGAEAMQYAALNEPSLKSRWLSFQENQLATRKIMHKSPLIKNATRSLLLKHNMPALRNAASSWSTGVFNILAAEPQGETQEFQPWDDVD